jgi:hypothetical protein
MMPAGCTKCQFRCPIVLLVPFRSPEQIAAGRDRDRARKTAYFDSADSVGHGEPPSGTAPTGRRTPWQWFKQLFSRREGHG